MESNSILIIEDEQKVASFISKGLEENGYRTKIAYDGMKGKSKAFEEKFDLILLDINLPGINGFEICKEIRRNRLLVPVLMLTALGTMEDKLVGFEVGADDYLVKPFEFKELLARIKALLKRSQAIGHETILTVANLELNLDAKTVVRGGKNIVLTAKEFQLLEFLMRNKEKVLSRSVIAEKVWGIDFDSGTNIIDVYINFLRKEIDKNFKPKLIHTVVGMGYILKVTEG